MHYRRQASSAFRVVASADVGVARLAAMTMASILFRPPDATIAALDATASRVTTPTDAGEVVWRGFGLAADRPTLVLFHGGAGSWLHWLPVIPLLVPHARVWAPDLPALGESASPPGRVTPAVCADMMAAAIRALEPARTDKPHLVGFSWGAHVATLAAVRLGDEISDLTLIGAAALGLAHPKIDFAKEGARMTAEERRAVHRANLEILMIANPARVDDLAIEIQARNVARTRLRTRDFAPTDEIARALAEVRVPVRAVWGAQDQISLPSVEARFDVLRRYHPELRSEIVADAGHWVMYEQPGAFAAALVRVLGL
jgi:pimeloyl-ACP methyl ester carboxylesterase